MSRWIDPLPSFAYNLVPQWRNMPFPLYQAAVNETEQATQAPIKMAAHCGMNAIFAATQGLADFHRPDGGSAPVSNISLIIGESGERKSAVDACFFREIFKFRDAEASTADDAEIDHRIRVDIWNKKGKLLNKQITPLLDTDGSDLSEAMSILKEHAQRKPIPPQRVTFLYQDTSIAALKLGLASFPSACVHSTEGMSLLNGALFKELTLLCELYSGETHHYDRCGKAIALRDRRLCVSAHSQPQRTLRFLRKTGEDFRDSGLAARMTVCLLESTQGRRKYDAVQAPTVERDRFSDRVRELLNICARTANQPGFQRRQMRLSPNAAREYLDYANWVERQMNHGGKFENAKDYANRLPEKIGRLAAALHLFEDFAGDISFDTYLAARTIYEEESNDFLLLFEYVLSEQYLADKLFAWLKQRGQKLGEVGIRKSYLLGFAPSVLRNSQALEPILDLLQQQGKIQLKTFNRTAYVLPGPMVALDPPRVLS